MSQPTPIDPARFAAAREAVLRSMQARHSVAGNDAWTLLLGGTVVLVILGWAVAFLLMIVHAMLAGYENAWHTHTFFLIYLLVIAGVLFLQERSTRGGFFSFAASDVDLRRDPENTAEWVMSRSKTHLTSLLEYLAWPTRAWIAGYRGLRGIRQSGLDSILPEAAEVLTRMLALDVGIKLTELAPAGTDPLQMMPILKWLDTHDYIGFSTRGDKVWVSSPAKKRFAQDGVIVPKAGAVATPDGEKPQPAGQRPDEGPIELA